MLAGSKAGRAWWKAVVENADHIVVAGKQKVKRGGLLDIQL